MTGVGDPLTFLVGAWVVLAGGAVGSFLNVVIARVPAGESIVRPASRCPGCRSPIAWYDNVPVLSWLVLRGRCRRCGMRIPVRYPLVELAGAAAAFLAWSRHGLSLGALAEVAFVDLLLSLALIDLATWLLPYALTIPVVVLGLAASAAGAAPAPSLRASATGAVIGFVVFAAVAWVGRLATRKEALGTGDWWLLAGIGAWLGAPALLPVVLLASAQGSIYGLALVALGKSEPGPKEDATTSTSTSTSENVNVNVNVNDGAEEAEPPPPEQAEGVGEGEEAASNADDEWIPPKHAVPFGPFLVAGALEWLYLSDRLVAWIPGLDVFR
jgi:leader peptidase (prepilin peptidase)/N-methyltransferase